MGYMCVCMAQVKHSRDKRGQRRETWVNGAIEAQRMT